MKKPIHLLTLVAIGLFFTSFASAANHTENTEAPKVDNSAVNKRDQHETAKTADTQVKGTKNDTETTRMIRKALTDNKDLSTYAKNIKIITKNGVVTLRGPVHSSDEKVTIESSAQKIATDYTIKNELEIKQ